MQASGISAASAAPPRVRATLASPNNNGVFAMRVTSQLKPIDLSDFHHPISRVSVNTVLYPGNATLEISGVERVSMSLGGPVNVT